MKITIVLGAFFPVPPIMGGAVEKVWFELAREFARRGHEVVQISRAVPQFPPQETLEGVRHLRVRGFDAPRSLLWLKVLDLAYSLRVLSVLPESDVVITNTFWLPILRRNAYVHVARYPKGQMRLYRRAARLQAPSRAVADAILKEAPGFSEKLIVIPYPAPTSEQKSEPQPLEKREKIILYVGRVHPEKGVHLLVRAFASKARTVFANWKLMIIGPAEENLGGGGMGYLDSLKTLADGSDVDLVGSIFDLTDLERKYRAARLFVYPSLAEKGESFGLAPLEAMTHRCAVLVSDLECFHDFVRNDETGFIFDHRSASPSDTLGEKLENLVADLSRTSVVAVAGFRESAKYSLEHVADQFLKDFGSLTPRANA